MTSSKATTWEQIAEAFERYANTGISDRISDGGLCQAVSRSTFSYLLSSTMRQQLRLFHDPAPRAYWYPVTRHKATYRAVAAQLLAELARDERSAERSG